MAEATTPMVTFRSRVTKTKIHRETSGIDPWVRWKRPSALRLATALALSIMSKGIEEGAQGREDNYKRLWESISALTDLTEADAWGARRTL